MTYETEITRLRAELNIKSYGNRIFRSKQSECNYLVYISKQRKQYKYNWGTG